MKKRLLILAALFVAALIICAFNYKWIYYRIYPFDRITGEYEISVNGKEIDTVDEYYEYEIGFVLSEEVLYKLTNDERFKGNGIVDLSIAYFNTNWWHISELDIDIDIVKNNDEWYVCYDVELEEPLESLQITTSKVSKKIKLDEVDNAEILIGI